MLMGAGSCETSLDASNILKPKLATGEIKCIGATTFSEYKKYIKNDAAFERRFINVNVNEPTIEDCTIILCGIKSSIESHHNVILKKEIIEHAAKVSKKYLPLRMLPDVAIDLIDSACAFRRILQEGKISEILTINEDNRRYNFEIDLLKNELTDTEDKDSEKANKLIEKKITKFEKLISQNLNELDKLNKTIDETEINKNERNVINKRISKYDYDDIEKSKIKGFCVEPSIEIHKDDLNRIISKWTEIPIVESSDLEENNIFDIQKRLEKHVFGQENAIKIISDCILSNRIGLNDANRPIGSFLFLGSSGVGKTELAKAICKEMFKHDKGVFIDMSEYNTSISVFKLIGMTIGYKGSEKGGVLTEPIKYKPYNVVLFDEIDLAHNDVINILYQLLDEGRVVDGCGNDVNFKNCIVIMTSNIGYKNSNVVENIDAKKYSEKMLEEKIGLALMNRIDSIIHFQHLKSQHMYQILEKEIEEINKKLKEKEKTIKMSERAREKIIKNSSSKNFGARALKNILKRKS